VSMIVSTFNVRELGGRVKKNKIHELVRVNNVDFLAVQETKPQDISPGLCYSLWGGTDCEWAFRPSEGSSGGILSIRRKSNANLLFSFHGEGYVGVGIEWGVEKKICVVVNIYSNCYLLAKRRMWVALVEERRSRGGGAWCVLGDFNVVCRRDERRGVNEEATSGKLLEMYLFNNFIGEMELEDLNVLGRRFTWYHLNVRAMSRIDRVLISEEWTLAWGENSLWVLPRDVSDHYHLVLKNGVREWGPKPFRFNNFWIENRKFKGVVKEAWRSQGVGGWMSFVLKEKLKGLKVKLKAWSKEEYGGMEERVVKLVEEIKGLDERGEEGTLEDVDVLNRKSKFEELWKLLKVKDALIVQRSRSRWLKEGDANSRFFHNCVKLRTSRNAIKALKDNDGWLVSPLDICTKVVNYFTNHVVDSRWERPKSDGVNFDRISEVEKGVLVAPFTLAEIEAVVRDSDGTKSPGPDGFHFAFVKEFWYLIKDEIRIMFDQFHANEVLPKGMLA